MTESLSDYLKRRAERCLAYLLREAEAVSAEDAVRGRRDDWPGQAWGIGQDGSIAGIVTHVAVWKQLSLPALKEGGQALSAEAFDTASAPDPADWPALVAWLREIGGAWNAALNALPEPDFDRRLDWQGFPLTIADLASKMIQHDVQHAAQIEYLRQLHAVQT